jgi:hypothetical protein
MAYGVTTYFISSQLIGVEGGGARTVLLLQTAGQNQKLKATHAFIAPVWSFYRSCSCQVMR